ncbi:MAG: DNA-3-methyladenine glycosylase [Acidobacteria bacterium]|nr:DNA-3-methyladenine glycosylase [Acidobacteriota bacterium]MBW4045847.1 DNA-3-methyladenine glycosylase [Acidobacteriota bacterium]
MPSAHPFAIHRERIEHHQNPQPQYQHARLTPLTTPLQRDFFLPTPDRVARALLGKLIVRILDGEHLTGRIVETEAYFGLDDPAAHAYAGETARNRILFGPPGHAYVYFIYGMHYCLNASCEPPGHAGCVLIRALEPLSGLATMARLRRQPASRPHLLTSGPGKLCQALAITRADSNGSDLTDPNASLFFADDGFRPAQIAVTPRIGISKAADHPARFVIPHSKFLSRAL